MSDIDIDFAAITVQVNKDWHDGDTMQVCKGNTTVALTDPEPTVGSGQNGHTDGFTALAASLREASATFDEGFQTLHEAFTVLGSADTAVGDGYRTTDGASAQRFGRLAERMSAS